MLGGNEATLSPEVLNAVRLLHTLKAGSFLDVDYDKQPVFDAGMCIYRLITKNCDALPGYPLRYQDVSQVRWRACVWWLSSGWSVSSALGARAKWAPT